MSWGSVGQSIKFLYAPSRSNLSGYFHAILQAYVLGHESHDDVSHTRMIVPPFLVPNYTPLIIFLPEFFVELCNGTSKAVAS